MADSLTQTAEQAAAASAASAVVDPTATGVPAGYGDAATTTGASPASTTPDSLTELEQLAADMGWNPDRDAVGDQWVDAKTYIRRTRDIQTTQARTIRDQNRKLDRIHGTVESLRQHYEKMAQTQQKEFDTKIANLKAERRVAIAENDPAKVEELDTQIDGLKEAKTQAAQTPTPTTTATDAVLQDWVEDNGWYGEDKELTAYAHKRARLYRITEIGDDGLYRETLDEIAREVKREFPDKFGKAGKTTATPRHASTSSAPAVEGVRPAPLGTPRSQSSKTFTRNDLNEDQRKVYDGFVELGIDGKQILADWAKMGEIA